MSSSVWRPGLVRFKRNNSGRCIRGFSSWNKEISNPANQFQIYTSRSNDPYINLSIEHHLFQKSPPGSKVLFLYVNRPCIVIGRNQNPWLEVNLGLLRSRNASDDVQPEPPALGSVDLVRRRSGGGTVFHDEGNVNWSVICDFTEFTRDKHAEMVVRALRSIGIERARVNERHDIVLDQGHKGQLSDHTDTHKTAFTSSDMRPLKVSGSAYKMARNRALHHGTALLSSPNLHVIPDYLHSPAKPYISAKGVESVSSPVSNIGIENRAFMDAVQEHFVKHYRVPQNVDAIVVDADALEIPEILKGHAEMTSLEWTYLQTPGFTFSSEPIKAAEKNSSSRPKFTFEARHGAISNCQWTRPGQVAYDDEASQQLNNVLNGMRIHETGEWLSLLQESIPLKDAQHMAAFLKKCFPFHDSP